MTNGFRGHGDAAFGEEFFDLTEAEAELMIEPNGMTDNFGRKAMALVAGCFGFHQPRRHKHVKLTIPFLQIYFDYVSP